MLDQLRAADGGDQKFSLVGVGTFALVYRTGKLAFKNRAVNFTELFAGRRILHADHDAVGMEKVLNRSAFAQELRVGGNPKGVSAPAVGGERSLQFDSGAGRNRALFHDQLGGTRFGRDL